MSLTVLQPDEIPPDIPFKCHPNQTFSIVICIICENLYHKSDFNRRKGVRYITDSLVICDEHKQLPTKERDIFFELKDNVTLLTDEHKKLEDSNINYKNKIKLEQQQLEEQKLKLEHEIEKLRVLNGQYQEKKDILNDLNFELKDKNVHTRYANITRGEQRVPARVTPSVIVKSTDKEKTNKVLKDARKILMKRVNIQIDQACAYRDNI
ncbi:hypothetical protein HHI36_012632 [Cryptolaemus montrouzieri]|uniref:Uncharacterized protein n=1 Tax=Cryptolaemus montrouzieri TaxID=559131 RepID=A0ABD2NF12_9CUCU